MKTSLCANLTEGLPAGNKSSIYGLMRHRGSNDLRWPTQTTGPFCKGASFFTGKPLASYVSAAAAGCSVAHLLSKGASGEAITSAARAEINCRAAFVSLTDCRQLEDFSKIKPPGRTHPVRPFTPFPVDCSIFIMEAS